MAPAVDLYGYWMAERDFHEQVRYGRNRLGAIAHREGIAMNGLEFSSGPPQVRT